MQEKTREGEERIRLWREWFSYFDSEKMYIISTYVAKVDKNTSWKTETKIVNFFPVFMCFLIPGGISIPFDHFLWFFFKKWFACFLLEFLDVLQKIFFWLFLEFLCFLEFFSSYSMSLIFRGDIKGRNIKPVPFFRCFVIKVHLKRTIREQEK